MSWDIVLFHSRQTIQSLETLDEDQLEPVDFGAVLENYFDLIEKSGNHRRIKGNDFEIEYFAFPEKTSNLLLNLYGEKGLFEIVILARKNDWQIFDTGLGQMLDLHNPAANGYNHFNDYLRQLLNA